MRDLPASTPLDEIIANIRTAAIWGWRFTVTFDPETWRPASLRPHMLTPTRAEAVSWTCSSRRSVLINADRDKALDNHAMMLAHRPLVLPHNQDILGGRLLWYEPDSTTWEQLPQSESGGFFDGQDCPPWETWVAWIDATGPSPDERGFLIAWVHPHLISPAQRGIDVSPTLTLGWLDERPCPVADALRGAGYLD